MQFQLKLKDGSAVDLLFSMYFLDRYCKLSGMGFQQAVPHMIGDLRGVEQGIVFGGLLDDLEIRANVIAAGKEAAGFAKGEYEKVTTIEGFTLMEQVPNALASPVWGELSLVLIKSLVADNLPKGEAPKKKAGRKRLTSPTS